MCCCAIYRLPPARATDAYQASPESKNPLVPVPPRPPSPSAPRGGRGPGRGAQRPFANQKNRRAQNDLRGRDESGVPLAGRKLGLAPRCAASKRLRERPGRVRSWLLFPARPHVGRAGPRAPRPSGSERSSSSRPSCSSCTVYPHIVLFTPRVVSLFSPQLIRSCSRYTSTNARVPICEFHQHTIVAASERSSSAGPPV